MVNLPPDTTLQALLRALSEPTLDIDVEIARVGDQVQVYVCVEPYGWHCYRYPLSDFNAP